MSVPPSAVRSRRGRNLGADFGPVGFHDAGVSLVGGQQEAVFQPEVAHGAPQLVGRTADVQPALSAVALVLHIGNGVGRCLGAGGLRGGLACLVATGGHGAAGDAVARLAGQLGQIGGHFQRHAAARGFIVDLVGLQHRAGAEGHHGRGAHQGQRKTAISDFHVCDPLKGNRVLAQVAPALAAINIRVDRRFARPARPRPRWPWPAVSWAGASSGRKGPCAPWPI